MKKAIRIILLMFFTFVLIVSACQLWGIFSGYQEGKDSYSSLEQYVTFVQTEDDPETVLPTASPTENMTEDDAAVTEMPDISAWPQVDFARLSEINPDIVGWIYIEGTNINYPVVQGTDNSYYLKRLFDGTYNSSGCIFLDYRATSDFSDRHSIIYGHHMKNKTMFSGLMNYKDQAFYDEHSVALLVTPTAYYKIQFFSGYVSDTWSDAWDLSFDEYEYISWLNDIQRRSCFETDHTPTAEDRIVTLSTCTYEFDTAKFVLHGYICESIDNAIFE